MSGDVLAECMAWMDGLWDDERSLLWSIRRDRHLTRDTAWYALGLLQRGDTGRAEQALRAVIAEQFDEPGAPYDGTFRRFPEEDDPPRDAVMWIHYDPNWRQFIGTTFAVICDDFADALSPDLDETLRRSINRAVETEPAGRVAPTYANIALMKAWLDAWAGRDVTEFAQRIVDGFDAHEAFLEYNSPTYYGINLHALALWRSASEPLASLSRIEHPLWRDIARFYHAGLRNLCGPFDRAYGMDMTSYASPLGLWIAAAVPADVAPFPDVSQRFRHAHDACFAPCVARAGARVPDDVVQDLCEFRGERTIEQTISSAPERVATAWLSESVMFGAQSGPPSGIGWFQHHHATMHWRRRDGGVGWIRLRPEVPADATAAAGRLQITTSTPEPIVFDVHPEGRVEGETWLLDGLALAVGTNASHVPGEHSTQIVYEPTSGASHLDLELV